MARTTDRKAGDSIASFYDRLTPDYDRMTGFEKRFVLERPFFRMIVENERIRTGLDAGCGTGFHSLLLSQLGVAMTAADISRGMLREVERHSREMHLPVGIIESSFEDLPGAVRGPFDAIFCLGNSLPHILSRTGLLKVLQGFAALLEPGGVLFAQTLNYDRILARRDLIQNVKEADGVTFTRSYEYGPETIRFNMRRAEEKEGRVREEVNSVELRPLLQAELGVLLGEAGFGNVRWFGGISMEEFRPESSKDLVVLAKKPQ